MNGRKRLPLSISETEAQEIATVYDGLLIWVKGLSGKTDIEFVYREIYNLVDFVIDRLSCDKGESLLLYTSKIFDQDYTFAHTLNVCIVSIKIGQRLQFDKERLRNLGLLALTHVIEDNKLPKELLNEVEDDKESEKIVKLADVYDAVTHPPTYRHAVTPYETLTSIIKADKSFDRRLIKILLQELSLYPKGSWVELCTKEIGRVIKVNKEVLLRPTVEIFLDTKGNRPRERKIVDLSKNGVIYILRPLTQEEIKDIHDRK